MQSNAYQTELSHKSFDPSAFTGLSEESVRLGKLKLPQVVRRDSVGRDTAHSSMDKTVLSSGQHHADDDIDLEKFQYLFER